eukprot:CAMPEP_0175052758 /NCGR_PEP_ID=MMETSP0052_2-20121109/8536_1 /TAXON_ID=51329 ORGANISM="Polytomella parva, Strain SAG 63-3" /NCGR_SAMPLE_ID=MMETSP0052_2 /ASSEMBLY_ACC=CAM_ASM_000194 /LENGTH=353 /DNA_ID=CAMNT_0016317195 /DNA_START=180 /DNA_END=1237 /DNA_ORIENTATION=-
MCLNGCHDLGDCVAGFCKCRPGHFGADCSLGLDDQGVTTILPGHNYRPRIDSVKVYVYELPPSMNTWQRITRVDRPLMHLIWHRLVNSGVRTVNGNEADYFFVPFSLRNGQSVRQLSAVLMYIRTEFPFWDKSEGKNHIFVSSDEFGRRLLSADLLTATSKAIFLHSWGLIQDRFGSDAFAGALSPDTPFYVGKNDTSAEDDTEPGAAETKRRGGSGGSGISNRDGISNSLAGSLSNAGSGDQTKEGGKAGIPTSSQAAAGSKKGISGKKTSQRSGGNSRGKSGQGDFKRTGNREVDPTVEAILKASMARKRGREEGGGKSGGFVDRGKRNENSPVVDLSSSPVSSSSSSSSS